jgi:hypothetical protein
MNMKFLILLLLIPIAILAAIDSTAIVNYISKYTGTELAVLVFGILGWGVPMLWRLGAEWAVRRKTTWYWNHVTQKFVIGRVDSWLAGIFTKGVVKSNITYQGNLPPEAQEAKKQYVARKYEIPDLTDPLPDSNECPSENENKSNGD